VDAWRLATEALRRGDLRSARDTCVEALHHTPETPWALHTLGLVSASEGDLGSAISLIVQALRLQSQNPRWRCDLGVVYSAAGRWQQAGDEFAGSLALQAGDPICVLGYARALLESRRFKEALKAYRSARRMNPDSAAVFCGLARTLAALGRPEESLRAFEKSIQLDPNSSLTFGYLADTHFQLTQQDHALACCERAVRLRPESPPALARLASAYSNIGELDQSLSAFRKALQLNPAFASAHSSLLNALLHHPDQSPLEILEEHRLWALAHGAGRRASSAFDNSPDPERPLRIGYLSGEFYFNPSFFFLAPILKNHDRESFDVFLYHTRPRSDKWTGRLMAMTSNWREVYDCTDEELASRIKQDHIDILIDAGGHFTHNRLHVFTLRAAPVQAAYPLYPATTGLAEMDYLFTDEWTDPAGLTEHHYTEQLCRLPSGYLAYLPPRNAPPVSPLPATQNGYVTFGLFQRPAKTNDRVWDAVAQVLLRVPQSRLLIHYVTRDFDDPNSRMRQRIVQALTSRGVSEERLEFKGALALREHLAGIRQADIALDTFPYNGQTTTCECLWMGVPVIALTGNTHVSRVGHGILHRVGLGDWVANTLEEYAAIAARARVEALADLRAGMRDRLAASSLMDGRRVTREIEDAYRWMWRTWCLSASRDCRL
jgi:protein O-GlcNAc transferase